MIFKVFFKKKKGSSLQPSCFCEFSSGLHKQTKNWDISTNRPEPQNMALKPGRMVSLWLINA